MADSFDDYDDPEAVMAKLRELGIEAEPIVMDHDSCLKTIRGIVVEQVGRLRSRMPDLTSDEVRSAFLHGMRAALLIPSDKLTDWVTSKIGVDSPEASTTFMLGSLVSVFRSEFGVDTSDPVAQETLMVEVQ